MAGGEQTRKGRLRQLIGSAEPVIGSFALLGDPQSLEIMAAYGFHVVVIDMEHTAMDLSQLLHCIRAAEAAGIIPIVRIPNVDQKLTMRVLDMGVEGLMLPTVADAQSAKEFSAHLEFGPTGMRGSCSFTRGAGYGLHSSDWGRHTSVINSRIVSFGLIETREALSEIDGIVEALDVTSIGRGDLSVSLRNPNRVGDIDLNDSVGSAMRSHWESCQEHKKPAATIVSSLEEARQSIEAGYQVVFCSMDLIMLAEAYSHWGETLNLPPRTEH